jgi:hypothetical protein
MSSSPPLASRGGGGGGGCGYVNACGPPGGAGLGIYLHGEFEGGERAGGLLLAAGGALRFLLFLEKERKQSNILGSSSCPLPRFCFFACCVCFSSCRVRRGWTPPWPPAPRGPFVNMRSCPPTACHAAKECIDRGIEESRRTAAGGALQGLSVRLRRPRDRRIDDSVPRAKFSGPPPRASRTQALVVGHWLTALTRNVTQ